MFGFGILRAKIDRLQMKWQSKTPKQKWQIIFNTGKVSSELIGIRVYGDMKTIWKSGICAVVISTCLLMILYTIPFYCIRNEYIRSIECSCPLGIIIPVSFIVCFVRPNRCLSTYERKVQIQAKLAKSI